MKELKSILCGVAFCAAVVASLSGCASTVRDSALPRAVAVEQEVSVSRLNPLLETKCTRCHDLGRVYAVVGGSGDWVKTVIVMSGKERGWISARELEDLATCTFEVASSNPERSRPAPDATSLPSRVAFAQKCSRCHGLGRAYAVIYDPVQWVKTVVTMSGKDLGWISSDTMRTVIRYRQRHSDYVERLFDSSCGACHRLDELQAAQRGKTDSQWRTTVNYMSRRCVAGMEGHEREALFYALVGAR